MSKREEFSLLRSPEDIEKLAAEALPEIIDHFAALSEEVYSGDIRATLEEQRGKIRADLITALTETNAVFGKEMAESQGGEDADQGGRNEKLRWRKLNEK